MICGISGRVAGKGEKFAVIELAGLGFKVLMPKRALAALPPVGGEAKLFTHLYVREDALDLYGFPTTEEQKFFEHLISVSGVGPKSALSVLDISDLKSLTAAIKEGRPDLLTRASGIGRKTAERIILELKNKVSLSSSAVEVKKMEGDADIVEALVGLGYRREEARAALQKIDEKVVGLEARLKAALKVLTGK